MTVEETHLKGSYIISPKIFEDSSSLDTVSSELLLNYLETENDKLKEQHQEEKEQFFQTFLVSIRR